MRTITTLCAVAALVAGVSIASAQTPSGTQSPAASKTANKGSSPFCVETTPGGRLNCKYASLDACQKDPNLKNRKCLPNPGTTGAK